MLTCFSLIFEHGVCTFICLQKALKDSWKERKFGVDRGRDKGQTTVCRSAQRSLVWPHLALVYFKVVDVYLWENRHEGLHLSVTLIHYSDVPLCFLPQSRNEWQDVLIVCFCLVCVLSGFSISVFPAPLWSRAHFCFVSLNIALIVALTEVKPLLISFVYIVDDRDRERERERERIGKEKRLR